ncbi:MAG: hypothetical protein HY717_17220 [Planctomycetes bacterium]|nr:hypothetical protein [Planctomycetota bacterium]
MRSQSIEGEGSFEINAKNLQVEYSFRLQPGALDIEEADLWITVKETGKMLRIPLIREFFPVHKDVPREILNLFRTHPLSPLPVPDAAN